MRESARAEPSRCIVQYAEWVGRALRGDLGRSIQYDVPVAGLIASRLPVTLPLTLDGGGLHGRWPPSRSALFAATRTAALRRLSADGAVPARRGRPGVLGRPPPHPALLGQARLVQVGRLRRLGTGRLAPRSKSLLLPAVAPLGCSSSRCSPGPPLRRARGAARRSTSRRRAPRAWPSAWCSSATRSSNAMIPIRHRGRQSSSASSWRAASSWSPSSTCPGSGRPRPGRHQRARPAGGAGGGALRGLA